MRNPETDGLRAFGAGYMTRGFRMSIEIDGRGTVMTCNVMDGLFAWVGQASLGGYIGAVFAAFLSSVISKAAGTYMVTMTGNQTVHMDLTITPLTTITRVVVVNGDRALRSRRRGAVGASPSASRPRSH